MARGDDATRALSQDRAPYPSYVLRLESRLSFARLFIEMEF